MNKESYIFIGTVSKKIGFKGKISVKLNFENPSSYLTLNFIYINLDNNLTPFKITSLIQKKNIFLELKLDLINCDKKAISLLKKEVYIKKENIQVTEHEKFNLIEILNFKVIDKNHKDVGFINDIINQKFQSLIVIQNQERKKLIPFVKDYIIKMDKKNKILILDLPEGLLNL